MGDAIGSTTSTTTLDHSVNEGHLRDFHTSDRSDWRFDLATWNAPQNLIQRL